jgi:threonine synthase
MSALTGLECPECGQTFDAGQVQTVCHACDSPILARYDLKRLKGELDRQTVGRRPRGLWRWEELLPLREPAYRISLGEGDTPLLRTRRLADDLGVGDLLVKDEGANPTGTFKARGMAVALSRAAELGLREFVVPTAGNAGAALAAYAARAGVRAHVYLPDDAPAVNLAEMRAAGADVHRVAGLIDAAGREAAAEAGAKGWFDVSTFKEPYRVEGKKTLGFELAEALDWELPDVIVYPTGGGTGLVGMDKAFDELEALGWIDARRPRFVCVQAIGCAPVVRALERGTDRVERWEGASTRAQGLRVPRPYADRLILRAVRRSRGTGVSVGEDDMGQAQQDLARKEGILAGPEGSAALAGLRQLTRDGWIRPDERVIVFNTGSGLKDLV